MKLFFTLLHLVASGFLISSSAQSTGNWPKSTTTSDGYTIKMYEWQTESYSGNTLKARAAIAVIEAGKSDPTFGVAWLTAMLERSGEGLVARSVQVNSIKLPGESLQGKQNIIQSALEKEIPYWNVSFTNEQLNSSLQLNEKQTNLERSINTAPPEIIYSGQPAILVSIDGTPRLQMNSEWGLETVINSPFTIIRNRDGNYFLYGGKHWYKAPAATGPYSYSEQVPQNLTAIETDINDSYKKNNTEEEKNDYTISSIIVSTHPTELIQTEGEAKFAAVQGTNLLYVRNTDDDIFMDVNSQNYYVLLSGRWYKSKTLSGQWKFVEADNLPGDFAKIPEGSEKEEVLASVAGTIAAKEAIEDAQVPQMARVDRKNATVDVIYDGDPEFEDIEGTHLEYAINSPFSVVRYRNRYYAVDNGVWFESRSARGPWIVSVERPYEIVLIPPRYPVYHLKYVYIYDIAPDYVYMGYTPGYLNNYICGPTIVYGTGYYYRPWHRRYYYPRPCTWGYNMRYSPWTGWGFGININVGWFNIGIGNNYWGYSRRGWWGPSYYRPNYCYRDFYGYGNDYYSRRRNNVYISNTYINYNSNIYNNRRGIYSRDNYQYPDNRRRDWAGNNNYNRSNDRGRINQPYNNGNFNNNNNNRNGNNNGGGYNNNNRNRNTDRSNREYRPSNNGDNNRPGSRNIERPARQDQPPGDNRSNDRNRNNNNNNGGDNNRPANRNLDRPVRQDQPPGDNRSADRNRNNNNNNGGDNNRPVYRNIEKPTRQYQPPGENSLPDRNRNNDGNRNLGNNNRGREFNNGNGGNNNGGGRPTERRENTNERRNENNGSNNGNGGGNRSGRRGG